WKSGHLGCLDRCPSKNSLFAAVEFEYPEGNRKTDDDRDRLSWFRRCSPGAERSAQQRPAFRIECQTALLRIDTFVGRSGGVEFPHVELGCSCHADQLFSSFSSKQLPLPGFAL